MPARVANTSGSRGRRGEEARLARLLLDCTAAKNAAHGISAPGFERPARAMYQIGG